MKSTTSLRSYYESNSLVEDQNKFPLSYNITNVDSVVEFGRLIQKYTRVVNCEKQPLLDWTCNVCDDGPFLHNFKTVVVVCL